MPAWRNSQSPRDSNQIASGVTGAVQADELQRKSAAAKSVEEIAARNLEAAQILQQLHKISDAVHTGNPAPHLRLVSDTE
jgi:hypothetical protein